jgi:hypothetical protein
MHFLSVIAHYFINRYRNDLEYEYVYYPHRPAQDVQESFFAHIGRDCRNKWNRSLKQCSQYRCENVASIDIAFLRLYWSLVLFQLRGRKNPLSFNVIYFTRAFLILCLKNVVILKIYDDESLIGLRLFHFKGEDLFSDITLTTDKKSNVLFFGLYLAILAATRLRCRRIFFAPTADRLKEEYGFQRIPHRHSFWDALCYPYPQHALRFMENQDYQKDERPWFRMNAFATSADTSAAVPTIDMMYNRKRKKIHLRPRDYLYFFTLMPLHAARIIGIIIFFVMESLDNILLLFGIELPLFESRRFQRFRIFIQMGLVLVHKSRIPGERMESLDFALNHSNLLDNALVGYVTTYVQGKAVAAFYETLKWNNMYFGVRDHSAVPMRGLRLSKGKSFSFHSDIRRQDVAHLLNVPRETRLVYAPEGWTKDVRFQRHLWAFHSTIPVIRKKDLGAIAIDYRFLNEHLYDYFFHRCIGNFFIQSLMIQIFSCGVVFLEEDLIPYSDNIEMDLRCFYQKMGFVPTDIKISHKEIPMIEKTLIGY